MIEIQINKSNLLNQNERVPKVLSDIVSVCNYLVPLCIEENNVMKREVYEVIEDMEYCLGFGSTSFSRCTRHA